MDDLYKIVDLIVADNKIKRINNDRDGLLMNGESALEYAYKLTHLSVDAESAYRKFEAELSDKVDDNGKKVTSAYAETQAKATQHYADWQRAKQVIDLLYALSNMAKALAKGVDSSYNAS